MLESKQADRWILSIKQRYTLTFVPPEPQAAG
jgi:hypothetical protein